MSLPLPIK